MASQAWRLSASVPCSVAVMGNDDHIVGVHSSSSGGRPAVVVYTPEGDPVANVACLPRNAFDPISVACDAKTGRIFVGDGQGRKIYVIERSGDDFGFVLTTTVKLRSKCIPTAIAISHENFIYVCDAKQRKGYGVHIHRGNDGSYVTSFGREGARRGELCSPRAIAFDDRSETLYVCDTGNGRVQAFGKGGEWLATFGEKESMKEPCAVTVDPEGVPVVCDAVTDSVVAFDPQRRYHAAWRVEEDQCPLEGPFAVGVDSDADIVVADANGLQWIGQPAPIASRAAERPEQAAVSSDAASPEKRSGVAGRRRVPATRKNTETAKRKSRAKKVRHGRNFVKDSREMFDELRGLRRRIKQMQKVRAKMQVKGGDVAERLEASEKLMAENETRMLLSSVRVVDAGDASGPMHRGEEALRSNDGLFIEEQTIEYELLAKELQRSNPSARRRIGDAKLSAENAAAAFEQMERSMAHIPKEYLTTAEEAAAELDELKSALEEAKTRLSSAASKQPDQLVQLQEEKQKLDVSLGKIALDIEDIRDEIHDRKHKRAVMKSCLEVIEEEQARLEAKLSELGADTSAIVSIFKKYDADGSGRLEPREILFALQDACSVEGKDLTIDLTLDSVREYVRLVDKDGDGTLSLDEFVDSYNDLQ